MIHLFLKTNIIFIVVSLFLSSCIYFKKESEEVINIRKERAKLDSLYAVYDSLPSRFDIETFNRKRGNKSFYHFYDKDSILIKQRKLSDGFSEIISSKYSPFEEQLSYDTLGILKVKSTYLYNGVPYGKRFEYDKNGKLINVIERNTNFGFTYYDLINFVDSVGIERTKMTFFIRLDSATNRHYWYIYEQTAYAAGRDFHLDAETGEILKYEEYDWEERNKRGEYHQDLY